MTDSSSGKQWQILQGDAREVLPGMDDQSVQCVVTSPPYWGLRDYGLPPQTWGGREMVHCPCGVTMCYQEGLECPMCGRYKWTPVECEHEWQQGQPASTKNAMQGSTESIKWPSIVGTGKGKAGQFCRLCGAWRGSLGLEPTPELYIEHLVGIFRQARRVLRDDGTLWLNIAGCYATTVSGRAGKSTLPDTGDGAFYRRRIRMHGDTKGDFWSGRGIPFGFKPKDWVPIPWMLGMALQRDGWYLRSPIIWAKGLSFCEEYSGSVMPESVRDRPTTSYEYLLLLTKSKTYYYDQDAVREQLRETTKERIKHGWHGTEMGGLRSEPDATETMGERWGPAAGRNLRSVWAINPHPFAEAHFATFPPKLVEPCIKAGTSEHGCCPECGKGWERVVERRVGDDSSWSSKKGLGEKNAAKVEAGLHGKTATLNIGSKKTYYANQPYNATLGWRPGCSCNAGDPTPCLVLDPFSGSGTTVMVALRLGRRAMGIDLSQEYCRMARKRIIDDCPMLNIPGEATEC